MPVPIVTENHLDSNYQYELKMLKGFTHDGLKFLTTRLQPTLYLEVALLLLCDGRVELETVTVLTLMLSSATSTAILDQRSVIRWIYRMFTFKMC